MVSARTAPKKRCITTGSHRQPVGTPSGGNQQEVIFGKMLMTDAKILLLYDSTRGVGVGTNAELFFV